MAQRGEHMASPRAVILLNYRNGELHCCHLDDFGDQPGAFLQRLQEVEQFFLQKPPGSRFRIWYNLDQTALGPGLMDQVAASVLRIQTHIVKIAFIGPKGLRRWKLGRRLRAGMKARPFPYAFFGDAEEAKAWLV